MKLTAGLIAAFVGCAAAAQQAAQVYMLPRPSAPSTPSISRSLARLLLLQRLAPTGQGPSTNEIPDGTDAEEVVSLLNAFGKAPAPLFTDADATAPRQLLLMLEDMTEPQINDAMKALDITVALTITNPPSTVAHESLLRNDFEAAGVESLNPISLLELAKPNPKLWRGRSAFASYSAQKQPQYLDMLLQEFSAFRKLADAGEMQTTIVFLPAVAETVDNKHWSDKPSQVRRRQEPEQVMSILDQDVSPAAPTSDASSKTVFYKSSEPLPSCFNTQDSCLSSTSNCTGHGSCQNKYAKTDGSEGSEVCYQCYCLSTVDEKSGSLTHWAGATCSKQDVSVAFWLFAGFTIVMVSVLWMSIAMLFNVGEEKLPGVIGAGVSRSK